MQDLLRRGKALWNEFSSTNAGTYASSTAYFSFLSLVPTLILIISLISMIGVSEEDIVFFVMKIVPAALEDLVRSLIEDAFARSGIAFSLSTITLLWSASKGAKALRSGLNATFAEKETRGAVAVILISIAAILILGVLVAAVIYLVFSGNIEQLIAIIAPKLLQQDHFVKALSPLVILVAGMFILCACYAYLPAGRRRFVSQMPGAIVATLATALFSLGFRLYVDYFGNYTVLYGSIATIAMLLVWIYLVAYILLVGAFINRLIAEGRFDKSTRAYRRMS